MSTVEQKAKEVVRSELRFRHRPATAVWCSRVRSTSKPSRSSARGRLGTYAVSLGQEAVSVGIASAMREDDVLLPSYRDNAGWAIAG